MHLLFHHHPYKLDTSNVLQNRTTAALKIVHYTIFNSVFKLLACKSYSLTQNSLSGSFNYLSHVAVHPPIILISLQIFAFNQAFDPLLYKLWRGQESSRKLFCYLRN